jgi:hypothetical protein
MLLWLKITQNCDVISGHIWNQHIRINPLQSHLNTIKVL